MKNERGAASIQLILFLPMLVLIVVAGYEVWKVLYVRQVLADACYQAVRFIAFQPTIEGQETESQAVQLVRAYVRQCPFIEDDPAILQVAAYTPYDPVVGDPVEVEVALEWTVGRKTDASEWIPFWGDTYTIRMSAEGQVLGARRANEP